MAESIIGLDIGSTGVKAVHLRRGLLGLEWVKAVSGNWPNLLNPFEFSLTHEENSREVQESRMKVLRDLLGEISAVRPRIIVSVPLHLCSLRTLTLPFSDDRKIGQVVAYEVEGQLPFPIEEGIVDFQTLYNENGVSRLLVATLPKETLRHFLNFLSKVGIDPSMVDLDVMALSTLAHYGLKHQTNGPLLVVDVGASKTTVLALGKGKVGYARSFLHGSKKWTEALAGATALSFEEAEQRKQLIGFQGDNSEPLASVITSWVNELARTMHVAEVEMGENISGIVLCGGGGKLRGLESFVTEALGLEARGLDIPLVNDKAMEWDVSWSQALGLALKTGGVPQASKMNFRKGDFAFRAEIEHFRRKTRHLWIGGMFILLLIGADLTFKYRIQVNRYDDLKREVREMFTEMFPEIRTVVDEVHQAQTAVEEFKNKAVLFGQGKLSALGLVGEITTRIPADVGINVRELLIEPNRVRIEAETESFNAADRIKNALEESPFFHDVKITDAKISSDRSVPEGWVRFNLTLSLFISASAEGGQ